MVDLFLKLVEQLIALVRERDRDKAALFRDVVEPLFVQLQPVVDDYFVLFRHARSLLMSQKRDWSSAVVDIRQRRDSMLGARRLVEQLAYAVDSNAKDKRVIDFAFKVLNVFGMTMVDRDSRPPSAGRTLVDLFDYLEAGKVDRGQLIAYVDESLRHLEDAWVSLAQAYASLRLHCLMPARYMNDEPN